MVQCLSVCLSQLLSAAAADWLPCVWQARDINQSIAAQQQWRHSNKGE